jgi:ABC-type iron transport system FetAB ATPase subunit
MSHLSVWLHGFKKYINACFVFERGLIHLLDAPSGEGKSTIFRGIAWCLYGTEQDTSNFEGDPKDKMWVQIILDGCLIYRQRNTPLLRFVHLGDVEWDNYKMSLGDLAPSPHILEGQIAQMEIVNRFGTSNIWYTTSYIRQKSFSYLLEATAAEKMEILNDLAYPKGDNASQHVDRVNERMKVVERQYNIESAAYIQNTNAFNHTMTTHKIDMANYRTKEQMTELINIINQHKQTITSLQSQLSTKLETKGRRDGYLAQLTSLETQLTSLPLPDPATIPVRKANLTMQQQLSSLQTALSSAQIAHNNTPEPQGQQPPPKFSPQEYATAISQYNEHNSNLQLAKKYNLEYTEESITASIQRINRTISFQPIIETNNQYKALNSQIVSLSSNIDTSHTNERLLQLKVELNNTKQSKSNKVCPHCNRSVKMDQMGHLIPADTHHYDPTHEREMEDEIRRIETSLSQQSSLTSLKARLSLLTHTEIPYDVTQLTPQALKQLKETLREVQSIRILPPMDLSSINASIEWWKMKEKRDQSQATLDTAQSALDRYRASLPSTFDSTPINKIQLEEDERNITRRDTISSQIVSTKQLLSSIPDPSTDIDSINSQILTLTNEISTHQTTYNVASTTIMAYEQHQQLTQTQTRLGEMHKYLTSLSAFRDISVKVQCARLSMILDGVNSFLDTYSTHLFRHPIKIRVSLFKQLKTTGAEKQQVNIQIGYKGKEISSLKSLSEGEQERINLLVTLALHRISGSSLLILDESFISLDAPTKTKCNELIRDTIQGSTVLVVSHEACEGLYDQSTEVKED